MLKYWYQTGIVFGMEDYECLLVHIGNLENGDQKDNNQNTQSARKLFLFHLLQQTK